MNCIAAPVSTICLGQAASMAALILAAGEPGKRLITPNAEVMIHQASAGISGHTSDIRLFTERMVRHQEHIETLLAEWTGQPVERVRADMGVDHWMTAHEALEYGLVDTVIEPVHRPAPGEAGEPA
jgi:ATP-dependent Clp protease protease subunit